MFVVLWAAVLTLASCAQDAPPLPSAIERIVRDHVASLISEDFQVLSGLTLEYRPVVESSDTVFFETYVKTSTILRHPRRRTYQLFVNPRLAVDFPGHEAVRAILAHELFHIRDYLGKNAWQLYRLKRNYEDETFRQQYERHTDQRTLRLGHGPGLIRYRQWLYRAIGDPDKIRYKKQMYMTPEEIQTWLARQQR